MDRTEEPGHFDVIVVLITRRIARRAKRDICKLVMSERAFAHTAPPLGENMQMEPWLNILGTSSARHRFNDQSHGRQPRLTPPWLPSTADIRKVKALSLPASL